MIEKHVQKFIEEVQKFQYQSFPIDTNELRAKAVTLLEGFIFKNLKITNPSSYSLIFSVNFIPVELHSLHQVKCALAMLIDLISDGEYLYLPYSNELNSSKYYSRTEKSIRESFDVYEELFSKYPGEIDAIVKDLNRYAYLLSEDGLAEKIKKLNTNLEGEIQYLENLLEGVLTWDDFRLYFGNDADLMIARLQKNIASKNSKLELLSITGEIKKNLEDENERLDIFAPNGFRLFDYLMKNHLSSGRGRQSDVAFFYRVMNEKEKEPLIHAKQTPFKLFVHGEYSGFEQEWKFKGWNDINTEKRRQAYLSAKDAIGLK